jgi:hypothetical protein
MIDVMPTNTSIINAFANGLIFCAVIPSFVIASPALAGEAIQNHD